MPEEANEVEVKPSEAPFLFVKVWRHNGRIADAVPVQSTDEAEALAANDGIWEEYGTRWFVAVPVRREVNVTYSLPSNGSPKEAKPELAPLPVGIFGSFVNGSNGGNA